MYKGLDRESLTAADGVASLHQGSSNYVPLEIFQFTRSRRGNVEMVKWVGKLSLLWKRLKDGNVADVCPVRRAEIKPVSC